MAHASLQIVTQGAAAAAGALVGALSMRYMLVEATDGSRLPMLRALSLRPAADLAVEHAHAASPNEAAATFSPLAERQAATKNVIVHARRSLTMARGSPADTPVHRHDQSGKHSQVPLFSPQYWIQSWY